MAETSRAVTNVPVPAAGSARAPGSDEAPGGGAVAPAHFGPLSTGWLLYEVEVELDPVIESDYDAWLPAHIDEILEIPGFLRADVLVRDDVVDGARAGWRRRTIQYRLASRGHLDAYLAGHAPRFREQAMERFGDHARYERRVLTQSAQRLPGQQQIEFCQNCGAVLNGQYCASCGQRARARIISLWHLIKEAAGDITHLDSRLWRTMWPLLARPGLLTNEYLAGRRARFIPPFRLYLGLSIVFFVLANLGEPEELTPTERAEVNQQIAEGKAEALKELRARGIEMPAGVEKEVTAPPAGTAPVKDTEGDSIPTPMDTARSVIAEAGEPEDAKACEGLRLSLAVPGRERIEKSLRAACESIARDDGRTFMSALGANVPKMMFVFLPLLALANKALYPLSRRYYVEHLLFYVHFHAFAFLLFASMALFNVLTGEPASLETVRNFIVFAIVVYIPIYLYKALRRVYRQGRAATLFKFTMVYFAYVGCMTLTLLGGVLYTAATL